MGTQPPPPKSLKRGNCGPAIRPLSVVAKRLNGSRCHFAWMMELPNYLDHVYCGQMVAGSTWYGDRPRPIGDIVLDGDPAPPKKEHNSLPTFRPLPVVTKLLYGSRYNLVWRYRPRPRPHCVGWGPSSPDTKGALPPIFDPRLLWPNGWMF